MVLNYNSIKRRVNTQFIKITNVLFVKNHLNHFIFVLFFFYFLPILFFVIINIQITRFLQQQKIISFSFDFFSLMIFNFSIIMQTIISANE